MNTTARTCAKVGDFFINNLGCQLENRLFSPQKHVPVKITARTCTKDDGLVPKTVNVDLGVGRWTTMPSLRRECVSIQTSIS